MNSGFGKLVSLTFCTRLKRVGVERNPWETTAVHMVGQVSVIGKNEGKRLEVVLNRKILHPELGLYNVPRSIEVAEK